MIDDAVVRGSEQAADVLAGFSAATIHEAHGRRGALAFGITSLLPGWRLCAPVMTVATGPGNNLAIHQALYLTPPGWALAVSTGGDQTFGYWGDILTEAAKARGLAGLVIEGGVRDSTELREMDFPIFAGAIAIRGTTKLLDGASVGRPISLGGVSIVTGDVLVADDDGVVCVPSAAAATIAARAGKREADEASIRERLRDGATTLELYGFAAHRNEE